MVFASTDRRPYCIEHPTSDGYEYEWWTIANCKRYRTSSQACMLFTVLFTERCARRNILIRKDAFIASSCPISFLSNLLVLIHLRHRADRYCYVQHCASICSRRKRHSSNLYRWDMHDTLLQLLVDWWINANEIATSILHNLEFQRLFFCSSAIVVLDNLTCWLSFFVACWIFQRVTAGIWTDKWQHISLLSAAASGIEHFIEINYVNTSSPNDIIEIKMR